ncbi:MAG: hypothetical protein JWR22_1579 [Herminiimonas sp.]|nr:hypothetical protein [Herminiimonas sp.]
MTMIAQFVFKARPGSDMPSVMESAKAGGKFWKKHGAADVSLWAVTVGEMGNLALTVAFESFSAYGKCYDAMLADPDFRKWQAELVRMGLSDWVRGNVARQIPFET